MASAPQAQWIFAMDQLNLHTSASLVRLVAEKCEFDIDLGVKGQRGILKWVQSRYSQNLGYSEINI